MSHETYGLEAIVKHPAEVLKTPCPLLEPAALERRVFFYASLFDELERLVREDEGSAGLAAPQLGHTVRAFALRLPTEIVTVVNPKIMARHGKKVISVEGCFSLDESDRVKVTRHEHIMLAGLDRAGRRMPLRLRGVAARAAQHELDHLDGILIIDKGPAYRAVIPGREPENPWGPRDADN